MSFKAFVIADSSGEFVSNGLAFATREEAEAYARDLHGRWVLVIKWEVRESDEAVNYRFGDGGLERIEAATADRTINEQEG